MKHARVLAMAILLLALTAAAQQGPTTADNRPPQQHNPVPDAEQHLHMLSTSLDLTADQQGKIRPILREYLDSRQKVLDNTTLSDQQRSERIQALFAAADKQTRQYLTEDQKLKLDQLEHQSIPAHEMN